MRERVTYDTLRRVITHWQSSGWAADLVLVTGDVVQDDSREAYENFCRLMAGMQAPVYCLPGNHDIRPLMQEVLAAHGIAYCETVESGPWAVACVDSCEHGSAAGHVAEEELRRLAALLGETAAEHVLVALHHPPLPVGSAWLDSVGLRNAPAFLRLLSADERVRVVLFGHIHQVFEADHGRVRILGTPSTCRQFRVASDTFAVDDLPPAYRRLTLMADGSFATEVAWVGESSAESAS